MNVQERIATFVQVGKALQSISSSEFTSLAKKSYNENPWFTPRYVHYAFKGIIKFLDEKLLQTWTANYDLNPKIRKKITLVMAGNIPLVGFHDMLSILISGHEMHIRTSSRDHILPHYIATLITLIEPRFIPLISFNDTLQHGDAAIATGSTNTSRYFSYYFKDIPYIIRKNRSSCAILSGGETTFELIQLGLDVFQYFGLGCRNVSKLYVPANYDFSKLFNAWESHKSMLLHLQYANNYRYQKAINTVHAQPFLDNGFTLLIESKKNSTPISVIHYEYYNSTSELAEKIYHQNFSWQCITRQKKTSPCHVLFGQTQRPEVWDYADNIDTLRFLSQLK